MTIVAYVVDALALSNESIASTYVIQFHHKEDRDYVYRKVKTYLPNYNMEPFIELCEELACQEA